MPHAKQTPHAMTHPLASDLAIALAAIDDAKLCFPDNELLESFVQDAIDPSAAARYLLQRGFRRQGRPLSAVAA